MALSIGDLKGTISLEDKLSPTLGILNKELSAVGVAGAALGAVTAAVGGVTAAIIALGARGDTVGDVQSSFDGLAKKVNETSESMLAAMRKGTLGTISDFELMKAANKSLGAGFKGTADDMGVLAGSAKILSERVGGETSEAFQQLNDALATGKTRGLASLGVFVDSKGAMETYAASIGKTSEQLTTLEQRTASQKAIMQALTGVVKEAGDQQASFAEKVEAIKVRLQNFMDQLSVAVNNSPVLGAAMSEVGKIMDEVFGPNQQTIIETIVKWIGEFAIIMAKAGEVGVEVARFISNAWSGLDVLFNSLMSVIMLAVRNILESLAFLADGAAKLPKIGDSFKGLGDSLRATAVDMENMSKGFDENAEKAIDTAIERNTALDKVKGTIGRVREAMEKARDVEVKVIDTQKAHVKSTAELNDETIKLNEQLKQNEEVLRSLGPTTKFVDEEFKKLDKAVKGFSEESLKKLTDKQLVGLVKKLEELAQSGIENEEVFKALRSAMDEAANRGDNVARGVGFMTKNFDEATDTVEQNALALQKFQEQAQSVANTFSDVANILGTFADGLDMIGASDGLKNLVGDVTTLAQGGAEFAQAYASGDAAGMVQSGIKSTFQLFQMGQESRQEGFQLGDALKFVSTPALIGSLISGPGEKAVKEAMRDFGVEITQELGQAIEEEAARLDIGRREASLLNLGEIASQGKKEMREFIGDIGDLMNAVENGTVPATEGMEALGEQFGTLRSEAQSAGRVGDAAMVAMILRARELGQEIPGMKEAVVESLHGAAAGLTAFTKMFETFDGEMGRMGTNAATMFMSTFNALVKEEGLVAAVTQLGDAFTPLFDKLKETGDTAAMAMLEPFRRIHEAMNSEVLGPIIGAADGVNQVMIGLADAAYLDTQAFTAAQQTAADMFNSMTEGGMDAGDAIRIMAPSIQSAISAAQQLGIPLDADMERLKGIAEQNGITFKTDPMDRMVQVLEAIALTLGATLPEALTTTQTSFQTTSDLASASAENTSTAWGNTASKLATDMTDLEAKFAADFDKMATWGIDSGDYVGVAWNGNIGEIKFTLEDTLAAVTEGFDKMGKDATDPVNNVHAKVAQLSGALWSSYENATLLGKALSSMPSPGGPQPPSGPQNPSPVPDIPGLATGGVVTRPMIAAIGEAGPEAVVPLDRADAMGMSGGRNSQQDLEFALDKQTRNITRAFRDAIQQAK